MARELVAMANRMTASTENLATALNMLLFFICVTTLVGFCAGVARRRVLQYRESETDVERMELRNVSEGFSSNLKIKRNSFRTSLSRSVNFKQGTNASEDMNSDSTALWQKVILRGERCVPLTFSGLVLYDEKGNLLPMRSNSNGALG